MSDHTESGWEACSQLQPSTEVSAVLCCAVLCADAHGWMLAGTTIGRLYWAAGALVGTAEGFVKLAKFLI